MTLNSMEETAMKKTTILFGTLLAFLVTASQAYSGNRLLTTTLIGAGGGALIGQAIGGDTESTLIGTAIGGVAGLTAASITYNQRGYSSISHGTSGTSYNRPTRVYRHTKRYYTPRHHVRSYNKHRPVRHHYRGGAGDCRIVIKHVFERGHSYKIKKRICKSNRTLGYKRYDRQIRQYDRHGGRGNFRQYHRDF